MNRINSIFLAVLLLGCVPTAIAVQTVSSTALEGTVVGAQDANPVPGTVVSALWILQSNTAQAHKETAAPLLLEITQVRCDTEGRFNIPAWKKTLPNGMQLKLGHAPLLRIYATGYHRMELRSDGVKSNTAAIKSQQLKVARNGQQLKLLPLAKEGGKTLVGELQQAREAELVIWRDDVDAVIESPYWDRNTNQALSAQGNLVRLIAKNCLLLAPDRWQRVCLVKSSFLGGYLRTTTLEVAARSTLLQSNRSDGIQVSITSTDPEEPAQRKKIRLDPVGSPPPPRAARMLSAP